MVEPPIGEIVHKIVAAFHPRRILMFGSRAPDVAQPPSAGKPAHPRAGVPHTVVCGQLRI